MTSTSIKYSIPAKSELANSEFVSLKIYDFLGREVATLVNEHQQPGNYEVKFNGESLSSGMYLYKLSVGSSTLTRKMILLR
jgi:hypothetical protein